MDDTQPIDGEVCDGLCPCLRMALGPLGTAEDLRLDHALTAIALVAVFGGDLFGALVHVAISLAEAGQLNRIMMELRQVAPDPSYN